MKKEKEVEILYSFHVKGVIGSYIRPTPTGDYTIDEWRDYFIVDIDKQSAINQFLKIHPKTKREFIFVKQIRKFELPKTIL